MAAIRAQVKRGVLTALYRQCVNGNPASPLSDALNAFQDSTFDAVKTGRTVIEHAGAGKSVKFQAPDILRSYTQESVFELSQELLEVYGTAVTTLISNGTNSPSDSAIYNTMMADDNLQPITRTEKDYTLINWPNRY